MEITKGENANLAGMEPRCPKCGSEDVEIKGKLKFGICFGCQFHTNQGNLGQFFRSPAPTPPLDVEAAAQEINEDEITRIRTGRSRLTEKGIADILRRHIASPAPQPNSLMEKVVAFIESAIEKSSAEGSELCMTAEQLKTLLDAIKAASPAQPEKE